MLIYETEAGSCDYDSIVRSINHRGYSAIAPENTLPAYRLSKAKGFRYVETDVSFTSDGVAMLLHDAAIDRTSNGSGLLSEMTFSQARQYDFGSWKSGDYAGTTIPTFSEFLSLCSSLMLNPYIELKKNGQYTEEQIRSIVDLVKHFGLEGSETYISFSPEYLEYIREYNPHARLGYLKSSASSEDIDLCRKLKTASNQVFYNAKHKTVTQEICRAFESENIPVEVWTVNEDDAILGLDPYISGVTSDSRIAGKVLFEKNTTDRRVLRSDSKGIWQRMKGLLQRFF